MENIEKSQVVFSILTPVYNVEEYLANCIESVLNQTFSNFELILVDDGSTDNSGKLCDYYASIDKRIRVYHKNNEGLLLTRRFAINHAKGDYYVFLDSDDKLRLTLLETVKRKIDMYNPDIVVFNYDRVHNGIVYGGTREAIKDDCLLTDKKSIYLRIFCNSEYNSLCRKVSKSTLFSNEDYQEYKNIAQGEDLLQTVELLQNANSVLFIPDVLYEYNYNPLSITRIVNCDNYKVDYTVREFVLDFLRKEDVFDEKDYDLYLKSAVKSLSSQVQHILSFKCSFKSKKALFEKIKQTSYYKEFLHAGLLVKVENEQVSHQLFMEGKYNLMKIVFWQRAIFNKIKRILTK